MNNQFEKSRNISLTLLKRYLENNVSQDERNYIEQNLDYEDNRENLELLKQQTDDPSNENEIDEIYKSIKIKLPVSFDIGKKQNVTPINKLPGQIWKLKNKIEIPSKGNHYFGHSFYVLIIEEPFSIHPNFDSFDEYKIVKVLPIAIETDLACQYDYIRNGENTPLGIDHMVECDIETNLLKSHLDKFVYQLDDNEYNNIIKLLNSTYTDEEVHFENTGSELTEEYGTRVEFKENEFEAVEPLEEAVGEIINLFESHEELDINSQVNDVFTYASAAADDETSELKLAEKESKELFIDNDVKIKASIWNVDGNLYLSLGKMPGSDLKVKFIQIISKGEEIFSESNPQFDEVGDMIFPIKNPAKLKEYCIIKVSTNKKVFIRSFRLKNE